MRLSGKSRVIMNLSKHDEDKLKLQVIFVEAADVSSAWHKVEDMDHHEFAGQKRPLVFRCPGEVLAPARKALLGSNSQYQHKWDMMPTKRFSIRVNSHISPETLVEGLCQITGWITVLVSVKNQGKKFRQVLLASESDPPVCELLVREEMLVIKEEKVISRSENFRIIFEAAKPKELPAAGASASSSTTLQVKCDKTVAKLKQEVEMKFSELLARTEETSANVGKELREAMKQVQDETKERYKTFEKQAVEEIRKDQGQLDQRISSSLAEACEHRFGGLDYKAQLHCYKPGEAQTC